MNLMAIAGPSALLAAVATVIGAVFLVLFFRRGQPWGTLNDIASIVMMLATIPVVLFVSGITAPYAPSLVHQAIVVIGVVGMLGASAAQALLVARVRTYEALLPWTLGSGAVVGVWYMLAGVLLLVATAPTLMALLAILAGLGYLALGYGFWRGNERHAASVAGGVVLLISSTAFLVWIGIVAVASYALTR
jgi:hypothetical protein